MTNPYSQDNPQDPTHPSIDYRPDPGSLSAMSPEQERTWGAIAHGAALVAMVLSAGFLGFVGSLAVYLMYKDRGPFVRAHAANSINVQITMFLWLIVAIPLILLLGLGLLIILVAPFVAGALHLVGAIKASNGEWWNPPLTPRFVR